MIPDSIEPPVLVAATLFAPLIDGYGDEQMLTRLSPIPGNVHAGMLLGVGPGGDYLEVSEVYWAPEQGYVVYFCGCDAQQVPTFLASGWRVMEHANPQDALEA